MAKCGPVKVQVEPFAIFSRTLPIFFKIAYLLSEPDLRSGYLDVGILGASRNDQLNFCNFLFSSKI